ncbi:MAG: ATP-binding cassette domain-containing protein [Acidimicrobiales bacterium]
MPSLILTQVWRTYPGVPPVEALAGVTVEIPDGDFVSFVGPSGSGKSTLLNVLALLDRPTAGSYWIGGVDASTLGERQRAALRSTTFGFVFQGFHLLDRSPAVENVELGTLYHALPRQVRRANALAALDRVGMVGRAEHPANTLSGGERQRVAIARAIVGGAAVLLADEPTGNLDTTNSRGIVEILRQLNRSGTTVVVVTHDPEVAAAADCQIELRDGHLSGPGNARSSTVVVPPRGGVGDLAADEEGEPAAPAPRKPAGAGFGAPKVRLRDFLADALRAAGARRGRAVALAAAVAVASALVVATGGLSQTASAQVSERFDARRNREVTITASGFPDAATSDERMVSADNADPLSAVPADTEGRLGRLAGVDAVGVLTNFEQQLVSAAPTRPEQQVVVLGISPGLVDAVGARIDWLAGHETALGPREVLVGNVPAQQLEMAPLENHPSILVNGSPFAVRGIIRGVERAPELLSSIAMSHDDGQQVGLGFPGEAQVLVGTVPGAARQVARQAAVALDPFDPERFSVKAPPDPTSLRAEIEADVTTAMLVLSMVAFLVAIVGIANAMNMGVVERTSEFGLRRALGARPVHVLSQVTVESITLGVVGSLAGLYVGLAGVLGVTLVKRWGPVLDLRLVPLALAGGVIAGVVGGLVAGVRASRIEPIKALRA